MSKGGRSVTADPRSERVDLVAVDDVSDLFQVGEIAAVKLDVEGMEALALLGMQKLLFLHRPAFVVLEVSGLTVQKNWSVAHTMMQNLGYALFSVDAFPPLKTAAVRVGSQPPQNSYFFKNNM